MLAFVFAVITLSNSDPNPVKADPVVLTKTAAATGLLSLQQPLAASDAAGDGLSISVCTFGASQLGPQLWNDASAVARTFTQPQCSGDQSAFGSSFAAANVYGGFGPMESAMPWVHPRVDAPVFLQTASRPVTVPAFGVTGLPRAVQGEGFEFHAPGEYGHVRSTMRGGPHGSSQTEPQTQTVPTSRR
jgi:hypothetical protein